MSADSAGQRQAANLFVVLQQDAHLIETVDAALADATRRAGPHLVCRPGCTQCCYGAFAINPLDAFRLRNAMHEMAVDQPARAAIIAERANRYLAEFGSGFPGNRETGILSTSEDDQTAFEDFANQAACPALDPETGLCDLYAARPMTCRVFGPPIRMNSAPEAEVEANSESVDEEGLAVCELCFTEATAEEIAAAEMTVPYTEEQSLLGELERMRHSSGYSSGETIIAYCLTLPSALAVPSSAPR
jgi:Fe-S-cluster containining protein